MKSIVEEAPSIVKAIEKAWVRAGNPREFSVKIFEEAQKSFFGLTTKQAKVGLFFEIEPIQEDTTHKYTHQPKPKDEAKHKRPTQPQYRDQNAAPFVPYQPTAPVHEQTQTAEPKKHRVAWNDEMLTEVSNWLKELLTISNLGAQQPTLTVLDSRLIVLFEKPLFDDPAKASDIYRSLSYLLIGMVRSKFKKDFRFLKIVLTDGSRDRDNNES